MEFKDDLTKLEDAHVEYDRVKDDPLVSKGDKLVAYTAIKETAKSICLRLKSYAFLAHFGSSRG